MSEQIEYLSARDAEAMRSIAESSIATYAECDTDLLLDWDDELKDGAIATSRRLSHEQGADVDQGAADVAGRLTAMGESSTEGDE